MYNATCHVKNLVKREAPLKDLFVTRDILFPNENAKMYFYPYIYT